MNALVGEGGRHHPHPLARIGRQDDGRRPVASRGHRLRRRYPDLWLDHQRPNWPGGGHHRTDQLRPRRTDRHARGCPNYHQNLARIPRQRLQRRRTLRPHQGPTTAVTTGRLLLIRQCTPGSLRDWAIAMLTSTGGNAQKAQHWKRDLFPMAVTYNALSKEPSRPITSNAVICENDASLQPRTDYSARICKIIVLCSGAGILKRVAMCAPSCDATIKNNLQRCFDPDRDIPKWRKRRPDGFIKE